ncbi:hypothetical protein HJG60_008426 [Phyllostomus discolor]|uniref:Uncharacterized protein n=1 Tax=Phyllostomus discolor TaxID=89673 RepID=A0A834DN37_9CHIR|nr:hypothetical protein HJG60_008426 [Phyllostomus discolor]
MSCSRIRTQGASGTVLSKPCPCPLSCPCPPSPREPASAAARMPGPPTLVIVSPDPGPLVNKPGVSVDSCSGWQRGRLWAVKDSVHVRPPLPPEQHRAPGGSARLSPRSWRTVPGGAGAGPGSLALGLRSRTFPNGTGLSRTPRLQGCRLPLGWQALG